MSGELPLHLRNVTDRQTFAAAMVLLENYLPGPASRPFIDIHLRHSPSVDLVTCTFMLLPGPGDGNGTVCERQRLQILVGAWDFKIHFRRWPAASETKSSRSKWMP